MDLPKLPEKIIYLKGESNLERLNSLDNLKIQRFPAPAGASSSHRTAIGSSYGAFFRSEIYFL